MAKGEDWPPNDENQLTCVEQVKRLLERFSHTAAVGFCWIVGERQPDPAEPILFMSALCRRWGLLATWIPAQLLLSLKYLKIGCLRR